MHSSNLAGFIDWFLPWFFSRKFWYFNWAQYKPTNSWTVKLRSASARSSGSKCFSRSQFSVGYTSKTRPPQSLEIYDIVSCGVIPTKISTLLWLLYKEYVWALAVRSDGFSMKIWKQSMITKHFGKDSRKQASSAFQSSSLLGHVTKNDNHVVNIGNHLCKILETQGWLIPNLIPNQKLNQTFPRLVSLCKSTVYFHPLQLIYNLFCQNLISIICILTGNHCLVLTIFYALL